MALVEQITGIVYYIIYALLAVIVIGGIALFVLKKRKKPFTDTYVSSDYAHLNRVDSKDYIKIDDIIENIEV